jgi:hypothetical protein
MNYKVGDILINTEISHPYKIVKINSTNTFSMQLWNVREKRWVSSNFDWREKEIEGWTRISPVEKEMWELYED